MSDDKDIIDKLLGYPGIDVCADAADEILGLRSACARLRTDKEKLRAELAAERESAEQYKQSLTDLHKVHCATVAELAAERERADNAERREGNLRDHIVHLGKRVATLREALERLVDQIERGTFVDELGHKAKMLKAFHDARAVLRETKGGE